MLTKITASPQETEELAMRAGQRVREGTVLCLEGELGAGKTLFTRALAKTLGVESEVTSPTFSLMNIYEGICPIFHFDLYRLDTAEELEDIGFYEYVENPDGIVIIEWADKFPEALPEEYVRIVFEPTDGGENTRCITFSCVGERDENFLEELKHFVDFGH